MFRIVSSVTAAKFGRDCDTTTLPSRAEREKNGARTVNPMERQ